MKRLLAATVGLVLFLSASVTLASRPQTQHAHPALKLLKASPTVVAGSHFRAGEGVRVTLSLNGSAKALKLHASPRGSFVAKFSAPLVDHCSMARVVAVGDLGSRASLKPLPLPGCLPVQHP